MCLSHMRQCAFAHVRVCVMERMSYNYPSGVVRNVLPVTFPHPTLYHGIRLFMSSRCIHVYHNYTVHSIPPLLILTSAGSLQSNGASNAILSKMVYGELDIIIH